MVISKIYFVIILIKSFKLTILHVFINDGNSLRTILVLFDTLNRSALGGYGGTEVATPNFDRLAARAECFQNHYAGSLPCMPARRDLHTGRMNFMHRSWGPLEPYDNSLPALLGAEEIYSHLITDHFHYFEDGGANYHTRFKSWDLIRGQEYDTWKPVVSPDTQRYKKQYSNKNYNNPNESNRLQHQVNRDYIQNEEEHPGPRCFKAALEFLEVNKNADNWFLQLECFDPHEPFFVPDHYKENLPESSYNGPTLDWPRYGPGEYQPEEVAELRRNYHALVAMCDKHFGRVLDYLDENDMWKDTAVIVTTDHGFLLGEHDWWGKNIPPYFEEISHIPLMVHVPDSFEISPKNNQCVTQTHDLMPTILDLYGLKIPKEVLGRSILKAKPLDRTAIFGQFGGPIGASDGRHVLYIYPSSLEHKGLFEYTLMPSHLKLPFGLDELKHATLAEPFDFTKNTPLLRVPAEKGQNRRTPGERWKLMTAFDTALYDTLSDPKQMNPIEDRIIKEQLVAAIIETLDSHDAPQELYERFDFKRSQLTQSLGENQNEIF